MTEASRGRRRVILITLDGVGIGELPDAERYGDVGAHTLRHVAEACGSLDLPHLQRFGLGNIEALPGIPPVQDPSAIYGKLAEISTGKDTTTGHWELAGLPTLTPFATYPEGFPDEIIAAFATETGSRPLGNCAASGTEIIRLLGEEHCRTGRPIVYTSSDSVFQIAAHEDIIPPEQLYRICQATRDLLDRYRVARVIARPFVGHHAEDFKRTSRRRDFSVPPHGQTLLDRVAHQGLQVHGIGKIEDIFVRRGLTSSVKTESDRDGMDKILEALVRVEAGLIFANLVDFDMVYGHRNDALGFARNLMQFDRWLPEMMARLRSGDLLVITADHGCDPLTPGTDHTREYVPLLVWHPGLHTGHSVGVRPSFADVAATAASWLGCEQDFGTSVLPVVGTD